MSSQFALGLLVPASNRVMEPDFMRWLPAGARLNTNRLAAPRERPDDMLLNLEALTAGVEESTRLLDLAQPDVIAFGCTSGSFLHGADWELRLGQRIAGAARTQRVVQAARAVVDALHAFGARKLAVATPYPEAVNILLRAYLECRGFEIRSFEAVDGWRIGGIANLPASSALELALKGRHAEADAIFISCTNFRAGEMIARIEAETGKPVVTANQATFWACARVAGIEGNLPGLGRLGSLGFASSHQPLRSVA
jgi:arylmalonate decarboxylase